MTQVDQRSAGRTDDGPVSPVIPAVDGRQTLPPRSTPDRNRPLLRHDRPRKVGATRTGPQQTGPHDELERRREVLTIALILITGALIVLPRTIQTFSVAKYRTAVGVEQAPYVPLADKTLHLLSYGLIAFCLWIIVGAVRDPPRGRLGLLVVALLPWVYLIARGLYQNHRPTSIGYLYPLLIVAVWVLRPKMSLLRYLGYVVAAAALLSIVLAILRPTSAIFQNASGDVISEDKQIIPIGLLIGIFTQANNLGQFLVIGLPAVWLIRHRGWRWFWLLLCVFALVWTASRGSLYALSLSIVMIGLLHAVPVGIRRPAAVVAGLLPVVVDVVIPLATSDPLAFTNRGYIWQASLAYWKQDPWFGLGSSWYAKIGATTSTLGSTVYHGHNQMVQSLVTGGIISAALLGILLVAAAVKSAQLFERGNTVAVIWLVAFAGTCLLEKSLVLVDNTFLLPVMVLPLAFLMFTSDHASASEGGRRLRGPQILVRDPAISAHDHSPTRDHGADSS